MFPSQKCFSCLYIFKYFSSRPGNICCEDRTTSTNELEIGGGTRFWQTWWRHMESHWKPVFSVFFFLFLPDASLLFVSFRCSLLIKPGGMFFCQRINNIIYFALNIFYVFTCMPANCLQNLKIGVWPARWISYAIIQVAISRRARWNGIVRRKNDRTQTMINDVEDKFKINTKKSIRWMNGWMMFGVWGHVTRLKKQANTSGNTAAVPSLKCLFDDGWRNKNNLQTSKHQQRRQFTRIDQFTKN